MQVDPQRTRSQLARDPVFLQTVDEFPESSAIILELYPHHKGAVALDNGNMLGLVPLNRIQQIGVRFPVAP